MIKRIFLLVVCWVAYAWPASACDACGCSINGGGVGLLAAYEFNYISLQWDLVQFGSAPGHGQGSQDTFHTYSLAFRYHLSPRFKVLARLPWRRNVRLTEEGRQQLTGLGDPQLMLGYTLWQNQPVGKRLTLFSEINTGVQLPVGAYDSRIHTAQNLPENFNLGRGSLGYLVQTNNMIRTDRVGLIVNAAFQAFGPTAETYHWGNQWTGQLLLFSEWASAKGLKFIPHLGMQTEWVGADRYATGLAVHGTGGRQLAAATGFQLQYRAGVIGARYAHPLSHNYASGEVDARPRWAAQFSYIF